MEQANGFEVKILITGTTGGGVSPYDGRAFTFLVVPINPLDFDLPKARQTAFNAASEALLSRVTGSWHRVVSLIPARLDNIDYLERPKYVHEGWTAYWLDFEPRLR